MTDRMPFMPLWVGDYLKDTMHLNAHEHGAYLLLIIHYWNHGPLLDEDTQLRTITRTDAKDWRSIGPVIRKFFNQADGHLHHKRIDHERTKALDIREKRRAAAHSSHVKRRMRAEHDADTKPTTNGHAFADTRTRVSQSQSQSSLRSLKPPLPSVVGPPPKNGGASPRRKTGITLAWQPDEAGRQFAREHGIADVAAAVEHFVNHHVGRASVFGNWTAVWRTWCIKAQQFAAEKPRGADRYDRGMAGALAAAGLLDDGDE